MENINNETEPLNIVQLVAILKQKTKNFSYQMFFNSLLGLSPETIDKNILEHRKLEKSSDLGM